MVICNKYIDGFFHEKVMKNNEKLTILHNVEEIFNFPVVNEEKNIYEPQYGNEISLYRNIYIFFFVSV